MRNFKNILRIDPRLRFCVLKICKYNTILFLTKPYKVLLFFNGKTSQNRTKIAVALCSMLITFLPEVICVISSFNVCRLVQTLLSNIIQAPNTFENRNVIRIREGGAVASWLVRSTPERAVRVQALAGDIVLCSWVRHFTLTVPLSTQVYKWVPANLMLGVTLRWTSIPSRGE